MLERVVIIIIGAGFAGYCVVIAFLTFFGLNAATLHLTRFFLIGYAAINVVLTPFGISGIIGGISQKKTLIKHFIAFQWWLATLILIGLSVFNVILSKKNRDDFIRRCQNDLAKGQPDSDFSARCKAKADDAESATFIAACAQGGILILVGIILVIVGTRVYKSISLEEETNNLLEKASFNDSDETASSPFLRNNTSGNINNVGAFVPDHGMYPPTNMINVKRQPSNAATVNVDLSRHPTNASIMNATQNSGLRRHPTDPSNFMPPSNKGLVRNPTDPSNFIPPSNKGLVRNPTSPGSIPPKMLARYPTNGSVSRVNVTRQPTIGNAYAPDNYVGAPQATYPIIAPQPSLSTKQYINAPQPSYITQITIPPIQINKQIITPISEIDEYNDYSNNYSNNYKNYNPKYDSPTKTMAPHLTRMGMN